MKFKSRLLCLLLCIALLIPLSGCSDTNDAYIYFELPATPITLDPQTASADQELLIIRNIFEGLLRKNEKGEIVGGIAENYQKNQLSYTFNLRDNATWSNGTPVTANDFVFAFRRAVLPETNAPFVSRLFSISGAREINSGSLSAENLGVIAVNEKTLTIQLIQEDTLFEETLTTSIAMPCNQEFFNETSGKYGLTAECILSNSSYKISRWRKDPFGIRIYRNDEYKGNFKALNAAVFITCQLDKDPIEKLQKTSVDMAFIDCSRVEEATSLEFKTKEFQNICWMLTIGDEFNPNMRTALIQMINNEIYSNNLESGYAVADSIFTDVIKEKSSCILPNIYNPENAKKLYNAEIKKLPDEKFPTDVVLYYYDNGNVKNVVTDIVGHWQSNFSAFINIESVSDSTLLTSQLTEHSYKMAFFPVKIDSSLISEYLNKFGVKFTNESLSDIQGKILSSNNTYPIMYENTVIAYSPNLSNVCAEYANGYIDFSFIIKND